MGTKKKGLTEISKNICKWKRTHVFSNEYLVSDDGRLFSLRSNKEIKPNSDKNGYLYYVLCVDGVRKTIKAHRLVAMAFIPNPEHKPTVDHINTDVKDNRVDNLRWATYKEQMSNPVSRERRKGTAKTVGLKNRGKPSKNQKPVIAYKDGICVGEYKSITDAAKLLSVNIGKVSMCANKKRKQTGGYSFKWKYESEAQTK